MAASKRDHDRIIPINEPSKEPRAEDEAEAPESAGGEGTAGDPPDPPDAALVAEIEKLKAEKEEMTQTLIRRQADFENFRKRTERDRFEEGRRGVERLVADIVPVLDAFDLALQAHQDPAYEEYRRGITLVRKQLWDALARHGVQRIEATDKTFDPNLHQAAERYETEELPDGFIVEVFQDGYLFNGRVLRPAIVKVAVNPSESAASGND